MEPDDRGGTTVTAKEFLKQYQQINREIDAILEDASNLRNLALKTTQSLNPDKVQTQSSNKIETIISKVVDMENAADEKIDKLKKLKDEIIKVIAEIPDATCQNVLFRRYICGHTWERIAVDMNYNCRWVLRLHGRGLSMISKEAIESHTKSVI